MLHFAALAYSETTRSDIIGEYVLSEDSALLADPSLCPENMTATTFQFAVSKSPSSIDSPEQFNIEVPHSITTVSGRECDSSGDIDILESRHPTFAPDVQGILNQWGDLGGGWATEEFIGEVAKQDWNVGYDFLQRTCRDITIPAFVGYLWFEPGWDLVIGAFQMKGGTKYLLLNFFRQPKKGCVYVAKSVGGPDNPGPVSDPSAGDNPTPPDAQPPPPPPEDDEPASDDTGSDEEEPDSDGEPAPDNPPEETNGETNGGSDDEAANDEDDGSGSAFNPGAALTDPDEGGACFPAAARVELADGSTISMEELAVGHRVLAAPDVHSDLFFFSHRALDRGTLHAYIEVRTASGKAVTLSPGHYVHVGGLLVAARSVRVGDVLTLSSGSAAEVTEVVRVKRIGKYAPHTLHGDIVVDGILVSTYTTAVHPTLAHHILLAPLRLLYRFGLSTVFNGVLDSGKDTVRGVMAKGPNLLRKLV